jgi:hypothetical protein
MFTAVPSSATVAGEGVMDTTEGGTLTTKETSVEKTDTDPSVTRALYRPA